MISSVNQGYDYGGAQTFCVEYFDGDISRKVYTLCIFLFYYAAPLGIIAVSRDFLVI